MPWVRFGDNAATYPKLLMIAGLPGADGRAVNEVRGWLFACATQSGGHTTDYVIDFGTASLFGGTRTRKLIGWCIATGLLTVLPADGDLERWSLINDPEFIHIRTKAELEWERQRRADTANVSLIVPVRLRDGDNCRYCGLMVQWRGRKSTRSAEYDHRTPGQRARTPDDLVVACRSCNGARQDNPDWDATHPLRPVPTVPRYSAITAAFLTDNGHPVTVNLEPDATLSSADTAAVQARPAAHEQARTATEPTDDPSGKSPETPEKSSSGGDSGSAGTGSAGTGRDGTGPVRPGQGQAAPGARGRRRRGKRGGRTPVPATSSSTDGGKA